MHRFATIILFSAALVVPAAVVAQDRDRQEHAEQSRRYEDKRHNDSHEWNSNEDQAYRRYLKENHKRDKEFAKARRKDQDNYWNWRHSHPDNDHR